MFGGGRHHPLKYKKGDVIKNDYRAYWEELKTETMEMLASNNEEIRKSGIELKNIIQKIEKELNRSYEEF